MKFDSVSIILSNVDEGFASVKVLFDPPLPEDENDIEEQPLLALLDAMLESIGGEGDPELSIFNDL